jgi:hypothetical protein
LLGACQNGPTAWEKFTACGSNICVKEALEVKDAYLKNPEKMLRNFNTTFEKGEDHVVGWLYLLRDSVLLNDRFASFEQRTVLKKAIVEAAKPYGNDPKLAEMANSVIGEIGAVNLEVPPETQR